MQRHIFCLALTSLDYWQDLSTVAKVSSRRFLDTTFQKKNSKVDMTTGQSLFTGQRAIKRDKTSALQNIKSRCHYSHVWNLVIFLLFPIACWVLIFIYWVFRKVFLIFKMVQGPSSSTFLLFISIYFRIWIGLWISDIS